MTRLEFIVATKRKRIFQKVFEYLIALVPIVGGLFFAYQVRFTDWLENASSGNPMTKEQIYILCILLVTMGLYGTWKVTKDYKILSIDSDLPVDLKKESLRILAENIEIKIIKFDSVPFILFKHGGFFGTSQELRIFIDKEVYLFDIHSISVGMIDWGYKNRLIKKIKNEMASLQHQKITTAG